METATAAGPNEKLATLFAEVKARFEATQFGDDKWYIVVIACLVASPDPESAAQLYQFLTKQPQFCTSSARQAVVRRLREALIKSICIVGVCKPIESILAIAAVEEPQDRDYGCTRAGWQADDDNADRAKEWFRKIYTHNAADTIGMFDAHKDFSWISQNITYGLYLSDRQVLDDMETQLVVLPAIMSQNLQRETHWHVRGIRRIGAPKEDVQVVWDAVQLVAAFFGTRLHKVPTVDQVEPDV